MAEGNGFKVNDLLIVGALAGAAYFLYKTFKPASEGVGEISQAGAGLISLPNQVYGDMKDLWGNLFGYLGGISNKETIITKETIKDGITRDNIAQGNFITADGEKILFKDGLTKDYIDLVTNKNINNPISQGTFSSSYFPSNAAIVGTKTNSVPSPFTSNVIVGKETSTSKNNTKGTTVKVSIPTNTYKTSVQKGTGTIKTSKNNKKWVM